jgi:putative oxidoreductase
MLEAPAVSQSIERVAPLIGRVLIAIFFIPSGLGKIGNFHGTVESVAASGLPLPAVVAVLAIFIEVLVAAALLVGWQARWAALILALFTLLAGLLFHKFWAVPPDEQMMQQINFLKNVAITGGLLFVVGFGAGAYSLDARAG